MREHFVPFSLLWVGGLEGETVQSELPVDVRDRGKALPAGKEVLRPLPRKRNEVREHFVPFFFTVGRRT